VVRGEDRRLRGGGEGAGQERGEEEGSAEGSARGGAAHGRVRSGDGFRIRRGGVSRRSSRSGSPASSPP
jgi:hypothetical protein